VPRYILGTTEFAYRLISIISGIVTIIVIWRISALLSGRLSRLAPLLMTVIPVFLYYSARSQAEVLGVAMLSVAFFFITKATIRSHSKHKDVLLAGIFCGLAIYTQFEFALAIVPLIAILFSGHLINGRLVALKKSMTLFIATVLPFSVFVIIENLFYPQYYPYQFFLARFSLPGFTESSSSAMVSSNFSNLLSISFSVLGLITILGCIGTVVYIFDIFYKKNQRIPVLEGCIIFVLIYILFAYFEVTHMSIHEYLLLPITVPLVLLSSFALAKAQPFLFRKIKNTGAKVVSLLMVCVFLITAIFGISMYNSFYLEPLLNDVPDGYGNHFAVETGKYISELPLSSKSVILCQSDVMGIYSGHPYTTWYDIWALNYTRLQGMSINDLITGVPIYETANIFDATNGSQNRAISILKSWNISCIVLSPEIVDVIGKSQPLKTFLTKNYASIASFGPYSVLILMDYLAKECVIESEWKLVNVGESRNTTYLRTNSNSSNLFSIDSTSGKSTHWFIDTYLENPLNLSDGYISFDWLGRGNGQYLHVWVGNDYSDRQLYIVLDNQNGWYRYFVPLSQPATIIGTPKMWNSTLIGIGDYYQTESFGGQFGIQNITYWSEKS
jgi:hypothetical protein